MSYYPNDFIEQVRQASDIVAVISEDTALKGQGDRFMGLCPFPEHEEKTPSFSVSQSKQVYHCFGCQNSGNIFTYLQKQRGLNFVSAVEFLARKSGLPIPKVRSSGFKTRFNPSLFDLTEKICSFYEDQLKKSAPNQVVKSYLQKRGWTKDIIQSFRLGYAPKGKSLVSFLKNPQEQKQAFTLGLLSRGSSGELYDTFRNRLIFPIVSLRKQVIGFGARALDDSQPKYINSRESEIFHKGQIFYGLNESARFLQDKSFAFIVEGYTDFLSLWQAGFKNLGATLGTALTKSHAKLLKRYVDSVVLVFDGDLAGTKASERSLPILLSEGLEVKFISLPEGQDPDDFIRSQGHKAFQDRLSSAKDLFFFVLQKKYEQLKERGLSPIHLVEDMAPTLALVKNKSLKALYKQRLLDLFGSDSSLMEKTLDEKMKSSSHPSLISKSSASPSPPKSLISLAEALESERILLVLCLESEDFLKEFIENKGLSLLKTPIILEIFTKIEQSYRQKPSEFDKLTHLVIAGISDIHLIFKASYPILNGVNQKGQKRIFQDCLNYLKKEKTYSKANELLAEMKMENKEDMHRLEQVFQLTKQRLRQNEKTKTTE